MSDALLRRPVVTQRTGKSRSWIYAAMQSGEFPRPVETGSGSVAWLESEITDWINARPRRSYEGSRPRGRTSRSHEDR
jgi:prophage regulatory protein